MSGILRQVTTPTGGTHSATPTADSAHLYQGGPRLSGASRGSPTVRALLAWYVLGYVRHGCYIICNYAIVLHAAACRVLTLGKTIALIT